MNVTTPSVHELLASAEAFDNDITNATIDLRGAIESINPYQRFLAGKRYQHIQDNLQSLDDSLPEFIFNPMIMPREPIHINGQEHKTLSGIVERYSLLYILGFPIGIEIRDSAECYLNQGHEPVRREIKNKHSAENLIEKVDNGMTYGEFYKVAHELTRYNEFHVAYHVLGHILENYPKGMQKKQGIWVPIKDK